MTVGRTRRGGSVAEWLACRTQAQKGAEGPGFKTQSVATLSSNSLRPTVYTRRASVHQAAKLVAAFLRLGGG